MKSKIMGWLLVVTLLVGVLVVPTPVAHAGMDENGFVYRVYDDGYIDITAYEGKDTKVVIPSRINGVAIEGIGNVEWNDTIEELIIPDGLIYVDVGGMNNLKRITIGKDMVYDELAILFGGCPNLEEIIVSENNKDFTAVDGVLYSKDKTILMKYPANHSATTFTLPAGVKTIDDYALRDGFKNLEKLVIEGNHDIFHFYTFHQCNGLQEIQVSPSNSFYTTQEGILYNKKKTTLLKYPGGMGRSGFVVPQGITTIEEYAFYRCDPLAFVTLPSSLKTIKGQAFYQNSKLNRVVIPDGVTTIYNEAFRQCTSLKSVYIGKGVTSVGNYAFQDCINLSYVVVPAGVTSIGEYAFGIYENGLKGEWQPLPNFILYGYEGTAAYRYAQEYKVTFVDLNKLTPGDLDHNQVVNEADVTLAQTMVLEGAYCHEKLVAALDGDQNGVANAKDVLNLKKKVQGQTPVAP